MKFGHIFGSSPFSYSYQFWEGLEYLFTEATSLKLLHSLLRCLSSSL